VNHLTTIDVDSGSERIVEKYTRTATSKYIAGNVSFDGPFLTAEGDAYYDLTTYTGGTWPETRRRISLKPRGELEQPSEHVLCWTTNGLYRVSLTGEDSIRIAPNPFSDMRAPPAMSQDQSFVISEGAIMRISDTTITRLDTLIKPPPNTYGCGFLHTSFNPSKPEILFQTTCDDGVSYIVDAVGVYDMITNELTFIDSLIGMEGCTAPVYSPDGNKIALLANGKVHIIYTGDGL
jgi:hypothetical protein